MLKVCTLLPVLVSVLAAQVDTAWTRRFNGSLDSTDKATAVVSALGGVYVTGHSVDDDSIEDFITIRYLADGTTDWYRRYDGSGDMASVALALAVDSAGNCYVTGTSWFAGGRDDWMTVKHDGSGGVLWATYHDGTLHQNDEPRAIAATDDGGCVVTGAAFGPTGNWDYTTIRYGADAETLWVAHCNGTADVGDEAEALALDTAGNVYVTGSSPGTGTNQDIVTVKYDPAGETLWVRRYSGTGGNHEDKASCLAVDPSQNVYVGGYTEGYGTARDFIVIKYSRHGDTLWTRRLNGTADDNDELVGVGTDALGRVYACGYSGGAGTFQDYLVVCYGPLGDSLWAYRWDYSGYGNWPVALAVDADGNSYVTGYGFDPATQYDFHTISLGPDGVPRWQIRYSGYADDWDQPVGIALDAERNVYVAGFSMSNAQGFDYVTAKYVQEPGVEERTKCEPRSANWPTVVAGVLFLPRDMTDFGSGKSDRVPGSALLDITGRKVMSIVPGENDVSGLSPGVYFVVGEGSRSQGAEDSRVRKVVVTR